ncbi:hypothetical protein KEJ39_01915 [Candidatus Bathyarchaeota archaeon]|nr:hypothetical protein [Candidatus Bathyarchaeota archaeon]
MIFAEPLIDALAAVVFLFAATFYLMVAYVERRGGAAWKIFGLTATIWFAVIYVKLIANMTEWPWMYGLVRSAVALSLGLYLCGLIALARMLR